VGPSARSALGEGSASPSTPSRRLQGKLELVAGPFGVACERLFTHPRITEILPEYLIQMHCIIRTTVPLMEAALHKAQETSESDPVAAGVATYLAKHIDEERHHDEWLLEDLEIMGVEKEAVLGHVPSPTVAALVGSQYYWSLYYHPVSLLGYFAFMEAFPPSQTLIEELRVETGYPREAFRTLVVHGELDPNHRQELDQTIDALPLAHDHETVLGLCVLSGMDLLTRSVEEVLD
jgi:Iron-containing redox enzyme